MNKTKFKKMIAFAMAMTLVILSFAGCGGKGEKTSGEEEITIDFLSVWQGDKTLVPEDIENNYFAQELRKATGITINVETNNLSELEKLNILFTSGEMPDLLSAPFMGGQADTSQMLSKAAREEMLLPLDDLIDKYAPNVKSSLTEDLTKDFLEFDLENPAFNGNHYFIAPATPVKENEAFPATDTYGLWIRKDILEAIDIDQMAINTSKDLQEVLRKIKAGNFKDINGKPIIPGGMLHSGQGEQQYYSSYSTSTNTAYRLNEEGHIEDVFYWDILDKAILHMRELFIEELVDKEGISQNSTMAMEKIASGRYGIVPASYSYLKSVTGGTLDVTNPEMSYVPLCPVLGVRDKRVTYVWEGATGSGVLCIPSTTKKAEHVMKALNWIFSEEGDKMLRYGIEGVHHELNENGYPRHTEEIKMRQKTDPASLYKEGFGGIYSRLAGKYYPSSRYGITPEETDANLPEELKEARDFFNLGFEKVYLKGIKVSSFENLHPDVAYLRTVKAYTKMVEARQKGFFAKTEEEALSYTNALREQIKAEGIEDMWRVMEEAAAGRDDVVY